METRTTTIADEMCRQSHTHTRTNILDVDFQFFVIFLPLFAVSLIVAIAKRANLGKMQISRENEKFYKETEKVERDDGRCYYVKFFLLPISLISVANSEIAYKFGEE